MGTLDFLFQGTTPSSSTSVGTTAVPAWLQQYAAGVLAEGANVASQPYQQYQGPRIAGQTPQQQQAYGEIGDLQGGYKGPIAQATQLATNSANPGAITQAIGGLPKAQGYVDQSLNPTNINPYVDNVIKKATDDATRLWQNQLQPSINNQFIANGQFNSSANQRAQDITAQQLTQQIQDTAGAQLAGAFTNAQQANLAAGQATGNLGQTLGGLGYEQGVLGMQGASQLGNLASLGQNLGIQGASALDTAGLEQQNYNQQNLNLGYQDFLNQQQYPYQQVGWLSQLLNGQSVGIPGGTTTSSTSTPSTTGTSPLMGAIGAYTAANP